MLWMRPLLRRGLVRPSIVPCRSSTGRPACVQRWQADLRWSRLPSTSCARLGSSASGSSDRQIKVDEPSPASSSSEAPNQLHMAMSTGLGLGAFLSFDTGVRMAMVSSGLDMWLPTQIGGMLGAFTCLSVASTFMPSHAARLHSALLPGVGWVNRWLPVFLMPVQVVLPTIAFPGGLAEAAGLTMLLTGGWLAALIVSSRLVCMVQGSATVAGGSAVAAAVASPVQRTLKLPMLWLLAAVLAGLGDFALDSQDASRAARGVSLAALGVGSYALAVQRSIPGHIAFVLAAIMTMAGVASFAVAHGESFETVARRDYLTGRQDSTGSTGDWLVYCLSPALVATGVQMFQYRARIFKNGALLIGSCAAVSLLNILGTVAIGPSLGISPEVCLAATMRCVTIPMGLPTYSRLCEADGTEGNLALVAVCALVSGLLGFGFSKAVLSSAACSAPVAQPVVRGIAAGSAAHVLGAAGFAATESEAFVWGMLAMAATGVASACWICACAPVRELTVRMAHRGEQKDDPGDRGQAL